MAIATVTSKGQVTIPKEIRTRLNLHAGDRVEFTVQSDRTARLETRNVKAEDLAGLLGRNRNFKRPLTLKEMDDGIAEAVQERYERALRRR
jgi:AbrB family looped-hinge helix DNA binding protein